MDAITNTTYTTIYGIDYVTLDAGFSIDGNSTVLIDIQNCGSTIGTYAPPPGPPPARVPPNGSPVQ